MHQVSQVPFIEMLRTRSLVVACVINASMGIIYVWSLFLFPLEEFLNISRSALSLVPAFALASFTVGMVVHDRLLRKMNFRYFAVVSFGLAGGGHLLFALGGGFGSLLIGYGFFFGFGAGLGYGLALALVTRMPTSVRGTAMGFVMAAFAISGVGLSSLLATPIEQFDRTRSFMIIGIIIVILGVGVASQLPESYNLHSMTAMVPTRQSTFKELVDLRFLKLGLVFFFICYTGLTMVAHATGIVSSRGLSPTSVGLAPGIFTFGYIIGSATGGRLVEAFSGRTTLVLSNVLASVGLIILLLPPSPFLLVGALVIGVVFGGSASLMPVLVGEQYGVDRIGEVYGKLMIAYGTAGLIAPWVSGQFFSATGSYTLSITIGIAMCVAGILLGLSLKKYRSAEPTDKHRAAHLTE